MKFKMLLARHLTAPRIFVGSFLLLIVTGTFFLWAPFSVSGKPLRFVDALFSSTSAVCVTGLTVIDVGRDLSGIGQVATLVLFQLGGLGIITFSVIFFGLMGRGLSFRGREILQSTFLHTPRRDFLRIVRWVLLLTVSIEAVGTLLLFLRFARDFPPGRAFFQALYHAVSAFNNCGYSLFADNLAGFQGDWLINLTVMGLIVLGGIGFIVLFEVIDFFRGRLKRISLHSKIVLLTTAALIRVGAGFFCFFESRDVLAGASTDTRVLSSFFQSITPRTCGFNTVFIGGLTNATILMLIILMFIGASPGSTGGGIKTSSFALLMLMIRGRLQGVDEVNIFNRTVPREILARTVAIIIAAAISVIAVTSLLLLADSSGASPGAGRHLFVEYLFETVSAFGTVGLSMGVTTQLNDIQKLAIIAIMFIGRVGPLTLAFSWNQSRRGLTYAEESVMVG